MRIVSTLLHAVGFRDYVQRIARQTARDEDKAQKDDVLRRTDKKIHTERKSIHELNAELKVLRKQNVDLTATLKRSEMRLRALERVVVENDRDRQSLPELPGLLDPKRIGDHLAERLQQTKVLTDPYPHLFVEQVFPEEVSRLLIEAIPPLLFFPSRDPIKRNFAPSTSIAPTKSKAVWEFFDTVLTRDVLLPALLSKFSPFLDEHYTSIFGSDFVDRARALPQAATKGRLMCRHPGYKLEPHMDPKRVFLTGLLYLPQTPDGDERFGTQIFRCDRPVIARYLNTYYPERDGIKCELVKTLPFRQNSLLVFMNSSAAHGAEIPVDQAPAKLERYAYQFYIGPESAALKELIDDLPDEQQAAWRQRTAERSKKDLSNWHEDRVEIVE